MVLMPDTIIALATPTGRSGIGVIRLSGTGALTIIQKLIGDATFDPNPRFAHLKQLYNPYTGDVIDEALISYFKTPHSFTGEDVVEISCHGSPVLLRQVIDISLRLDARMADPGEFTLRALANGRMNLAEAEAIRDLIDAQTTASARQAIKQLQGEFSKRLQPLKDDLLNVIVVLESAIEFVEDDLPEMQTDKIKAKLAEIVEETGKLAATFQAGRLIREGLRVALVGQPNVGKSSLFNALLGTDRAIVTEIAGTTRDQIHERFIINEIPISLMDTAGLRESTDMVERIGVERSRATMADADLVIVILDATENIGIEDKQILESVQELNHFIAINKIDIAAEKVEKLSDDLNSEFCTPHSALIKISAKTGHGLDDLRNAIIRPFAPEDMTNSGFLITNARHHDLLVRTGQEIEQSLHQLEQKLSEEIVLIGLHNALRYLGQITGETTTEDMLTQIFATFCIGK